MWFALPLEVCNLRFFGGIVQAMGKAFRMPQWAIGGLHTLDISCFDFWALLGLMQQSQGDFVFKDGQGESKTFFHPLSRTFDQDVKVIQPSFLIGSCG